MSADNVTATGTETAAPVHLVEIKVNERPVEVNGPRISGLAIKQAAIAQGVPIQPDFVLSEELPAGRSKIVGDDDIVTVNNHSKFLAVPNDDNS
jgi:Multiubiquitin